MKKLYTVLFVILTWPAFAQIKVVDGDSLEIDGEKIRLIGIDAPEYFQVCYRANGQLYDCGKESLSYLEELVRQAEEITCEKLDIDRYERALCICRADGLDLNEAMVRSGHAISYWHHWYDSAQEKAKQARIGLWQGRFMRPEIWRILHRKNKHHKKS